jgi:murein tripeptide amidase MpaA
MHDTEGETIDDVKRERDEWKARAGTEREAHTATLERMMKVATWHADAERERDELGIQLEALRERMQLAMAVVEHARAHDHDDVGLAAAIDALDAVPGDALATPAPGGKK